MVKKGMKMTSKIKDKFVHIFVYCTWLYLFKMRKAKVDIPITKVLDYKQGVVWGWWENVNSSDNALNKTEFKTPSLDFLQFNVASDLVPGFPGEGFDNCHSKCCVINTNREEATDFSKEEA